MCCVFPPLVSQFGRSALHKASSHGHVEVVSRLLQAGVDIENKDKVVKNPILHTPTRVGGGLRSD